MSREWWLTVVLSFGKQPIHTTCCWLLFYIVSKFCSSNKIDLPFTFLVFMLPHFYFYASTFLFSCFCISFFMLLHFSFLYMWDICQNVKPERQSFVSKKTNTYSMYKSKTINFVKLTILLYKGNLEKFGQRRPSIFFLNLKTSIQKTLTRFLFFI